MGAYAKTAPGERLTYRPADLSRYDGERFCLRITPEDIDLERCFFVYLDETFEEDSLRRLFQTYFVAPKPDAVDEMQSWLEPWLRIDPMLPKKYALLRQMIARVNASSGKIQFHINHGPGPVNSEDTVRSHLGTSVFADGSFDDKILDLVLEFHAEDETLPELDQWARFSQISTSGATGPTSRVKRRRFVSQLVMGLVAVLTLPLMLFSCRGNNNGNGGGGFGGGML
ncbi:MAG: hypothetical protein JWN86_159 [Planctomycetota bacterium]|nr:hypothetical protein [Planctomycetota bacterium]